MVQTPDRHAPLTALGDLLMEKISFSLFQAPDRHAPLAALRDLLMG